MNRAQRSTVVEELLSPGVVAFELRGPASPSDLLPSELRCVHGAVRKRQSEFAAGRLCARAALAALGCDPVPLPMGPDRMPQWPTGVVGSITHTDGYCVAVVAWAKHYAAIGVDAECVGAVDSSLWATILHPDELLSIKGLDEARQLQTITVIFSAKEAFYKCQYPLTHRWVGFDEVTVKITGSSFELSTVHNTPVQHCLSRTWRGRFVLSETLVVAGIAVERGPD